jgi:hypothetical protein
MAAIGLQLAGRIWMQRPHGPWHLSVPFYIALDTCAFLYLDADIGLSMPMVKASLTELKVFAVAKRTGRGFSLNLGSNVISREHESQNSVNFIPVEDVDISHAMTVTDSQFCC